MKLCSAAAGLLLLALGSLQALASAPLREGFEQAETAWRDAGGDGAYKITLHERATAGAHSGHGCERVQVSGDNGTYVYLSYEIGAARIISELAASVWIKSDRPGLQILVHVVLPRSIDPATGRPLSTLLRGSGYTQAGNWQQLRIDTLSPQLERQVRVLRAQHGAQVDDHEAYVDRVLLNIYGGPGTTSVSIDDLEVTGIVAPAAGLAAGAPSRPRMPDEPAQRLPATSAQAVSAGALPTPGLVAHLSGAGLMLGDKPFFPRLIEYRGEPLDRLKALGFNGIHLTGPLQSAELLREAAHTQMWVVMPPPSSVELEARLARGPAGKLGPEFDQVLAWDLGRDLSTREIDAVKRWSRLVRSADPRKRPMLCDPDSDLLAYSRSVDLLMTHRTPLGTSLDLNQYAIWLRSRPQLARPGTPMWTLVQTQPAERLVEQVAMLAGSGAVSLAWQDEQIRLLTFAALSGGVRGIAFQSQAPLTTADPATRRRAALLELINLELELIEPWCAAGNFVTTANGAEPEATAAVMQTDRARLVLPLAGAPQSQYAVRMPAGGTSRYVVPGVPESNDAYELTPAGLRPLAHKRVAGGIGVVLPDGQQGSLIVLTQDSQVISNLTRRVARSSRRAATLKHELATMHLADIERIEPRLAEKARSNGQARSLVEAARGNLKQADARLAQGGYEDVYFQSRRADHALYQLERACWDRIGQSVTAPPALPLGVSYDTLPEYWQFVGRTSAASRQANLLAAGELEDLQQMLQSGWRHFQHPQAALATDVQLASERVHGGKLALRLEVKPAKPDQPPALVETAPLWVTTAPVPLEAGQVVCIRGWVNVPKPMAGSVDGLLIIDSLGGEALAERIGQTAGWRQVNLYRAAARAESLVVTFALTGLGEAWLDDFSIQNVEAGEAPPVVSKAADKRSQTAARR